MVALAEGYGRAGPNVRLLRAKAGCQRAPA